MARSACIWDALNRNSNRTNITSITNNKLNGIDFGFWILDFTV